VPFAAGTADRWGSLQRNRPERMPTDTPLSPALRAPRASDATTASLDPLARDATLAGIEAILLLADEPLPLRKLAAVAGLPDAPAARRAIRKLQTLLENDGSAFQIEEVAGGFQLLTRGEFHRWLASLRRGHQETRLSGPARETLAIVAYQQPLTRADIEAIRGVHCGETLRLLMEKGLIKIAGRHASLGRPVLYGTTKKFLQVYGLKTLKDLPRKTS
jgi:segregation and condensation protein B